MSGRTIGRFQKRPSGDYLGEIITLSVQAKDVAITAIEGASDQGPHYRVTVGLAEIGLGWHSQGSNGARKIEFELDDPSFSATIRAELVEEGDDQEARLTWSR